MKSILQEASSVERAIDKAWNEAGKPKEFTIKILDHGERNFFGLTRRPAIVSILYKPEKSSYQEQKSRLRDDRRSDRRSSSRRSSDSRSSDNRSSESGSRGASRSRSSSNNMQAGWRDEWQTQVTDNVRHILKHMNIKTSFDAKVTDDKVLTLTFKSSVLPDAEEQRMFFASLSYLSIQFLKREYKNRFTGFRIVVTGPEPKGQKAQSVEEATEVKEATTEKSSERRSNGRRSGSRTAGRSSGRSSSRGKRGDFAGNGDHADEQRKFAQQQLEQEGGHEVFERAQVKDDAPQKPADMAEAIDAAAKEAYQAEEPKRPAAKPLKKETKYQPFFILPDEQDGDK